MHLKDGETNKIDQIFGAWEAQAEDQAGLILNNNRAINHNNQQLGSVRLLEAELDLEEQAPLEIFYSCHILYIFCVNLEFYILLSLL